MRRHAPKAKELIRKGDYEGAAEVMINKAEMSPEEAVAYIKRQAAPLMTERQLTDFLMHADSVERLRLEHQLEALK